MSVRKKLKSRAGVSMIEMLMAVILLALLTAGGAAASSAVLAGRNRMIEAANAETLASTAAEALANEIRLGKNIQLAGDASGAATSETTSDFLKLDSVFFGPDTVLYLEKESDTNLAALGLGRLVARTPKEGGTPAEAVTKQLLSEDAYSELYIKDLSFTKEPASTAVPPPAGENNKTGYTISFTVCSSQGNVLWTDTVTAAPMGE